MAPLDSIHPDIRDGVRAVCNQFDSAYWQKIDHARAYPEAFVDALTGAGWLAKGVHDPAQLADLMAAAAHRSPLGQAWLETDMRAHCNPTRMAAIRQLAFRLVRRVASACPACDSPGWGLVSRLPGLPCSSCGLSTELMRFEQLGCVSCDHTQLKPRRDGLISADPRHCPYCNP